MKNGAFEIWRESESERCEVAAMLAEGDGVVPVVGLVATSRRAARPVQCELQSVL